MKNIFKEGKASPLIVAVISFLAMMLVIQILSWQYDAFFKEETVSFEQRVEQVMAKESLRGFLKARTEGNQEKAVSFLTEAAVQQVSLGEVSLLGFDSFDILEEEDKGSNNFVFLVKMLSNNGSEAIELIKVKKIDEKYYIDSIERPG